MTENLVNHINNIIPIDYLTKDNIRDIIEILTSNLMPLIQSKPVKQRKEIQKRILSWTDLVQNDQLDDILLEIDEANELTGVLNTFILENIEKIVSLTEDEKTSLVVLKNNEYHYLYLVQNNVPICYEVIDLKTLIIDQQDFIQFCFSQTIFDRNDTLLSIENKYINHFFEYLDNFVYCIEQYIDINIVCISPNKFGQHNSNVLKSMISEKQFLLNRPTNIYYYHNDNLYIIKYYNLIENRIFDYNEIKTPHSDFRLKRLLKIEYEKVDLDKLVIRYEPTDIGRKLPVINVTINHKTVKLLVGSTYNLYLYSSGDTINEKNIIVGKIDIISINGDEKVGKGNIYWIEGYQDLL